MNPHSLLALLQGSRHDILRQTQVLTQVLDALVSEEPGDK
jgi:hypothetical protein